MKVNEILSEAAAKLTFVGRLLAVKIGEKPDTNLLAKMERLAETAEKAIIKKVASDPNRYGLDYDVKSADVRRSANAWAQRIGVQGEQIIVFCNLDLDDIGGDSTNYMEVKFDSAGKVVGITSEGDYELEAEFDAQEKGYPRVEVDY